MIYGYIRVSSTGQAGEDKTSLSEQQKKIEAAATVMGAAVERVFEDPGVSGGLPISKRPEGALLWAALKSGDTLIAAKLDRLFRNLGDAAQTITALADQGIDLVCLDMGFEPVGKSASGRLLLYVHAMFADYERELIKERTWSGKVAAKAKGQHVAGVAPRGFDLDGKHLVPNSEYAAMQAAWRIYASEGVVKDCLTTAEAMGLRSRSGKPLRLEQMARSLALWDSLPDDLRNL